MSWITSTKNVLSGIHFVGYTAGVISFEYTKYGLTNFANSALRIFGQKSTPTTTTTTTTSSAYVNMVKSIAARLSKKNIYYTKMFQALAYSSEIYDDELASFFIQYTDAVHYEDSEYSNDYLNQVVEFADKKGYDLTISSNVRNGKYIPDKTGSVSLIFYGTLTNRNDSNSASMPIVIKYLRANMLERVKSAINDVSYMIAILNLLPQLKHLYLDDILSEQKKMMLSQVNFHTEVENILKMYDNFQKTNTTIIKIPVVFKEFTDEFDNIIVMERIVGRKLEELPMNDVKDQYCMILAKGLIKTVFLDGFYHCDLHPGNVLFIENDDGIFPRLQVAILDFGIMSNISTHDQELSFNMFRNVLARNSKEIAKNFVDGFIEPCDNRTTSQPSYDNAGICKTLEVLLSDILKDKTLTCFTAKDLCAMNYAILKYNMKVSKSLTNFEISLSVCDNLCKKIAFSRTYMDHLKSIVDDMFD
jgi:predicted unusual protein kinase regulating ubiquinone biosynthesis (AarF/ABC1/UbiB family)